ncbi:hypothetical protein Tco_0932474 [Tanacetum coccineum]
MEAGSSTMVTAAKLLEVIVNGDSPPPKRTVDGVEQTYPPTTAEEKLARKNELKAREAQQAAGGPTSLGATNEKGAHPQLSSGHDASANSIAEADPRLSAPNDSIPSQHANEISNKIKLKDLSDILKDIRSAFFTPDSPQDEPIIVLDESEEEEVEKDNTHATSHDVPGDTSIPHPPSPKSAQIQELMAQSSHQNSLNYLEKEIKELKKHVQDMEIELPGDLKEIPTKLETFTSIISSLSSQVAELKNIQWELPADFFYLHSDSTSGHDALANSTVEDDPRLTTPNDSIPSQQDGLKTAHTDLDTNEESRANEISKKLKLEDLSDILKDIRSAFFTPDSPQDEPIIVLDKSEEEEKDELEQQKEKGETEVASLKARPSYPDINQLIDLLVTSLKPEFSKLLASHDFASCLPTALKELPSKFTELSGEIKELKKHVQDMEIELHGDLKEIPTKLETFTSTISSLLSQEKVKSLDSLPNLLNKVTDTLNKFATMVENASAGQASASPAEGEKNTTKDAKINLQNKLVDLLGIDMVE